MEKLKALLHIDEMNKWELALTNARNLLDDKGESGVQIEILANGPAVELFSGEAASAGLAYADVIQQLESLSVRNVTIAVCRNALRSHGIEEKTLPAFVIVVPAGITELLLQQANGFFYIKP